jgi:hypothetical protein
MPRSISQAFPSVRQQNTRFNGEIWQRIKIVLTVRGFTSVTDFVRRAVLNELRQHELELFGDSYTRQRLAILSFIGNGCRSVEDVKYVCQSATPTEIEATLFSLEQDGYLERKDAKRGRTWQWNLTSKGESWLKEKRMMAE